MASAASGEPGSRDLRVVGDSWIGSRDRLRQLPPVPSGRASSHSPQPWQPSRPESASGSGAAPGKLRIQARCTASQSAAQAATTSGASQGDIAQPPPPRPAKPMKATERMPAITSASAVPLTTFGVSASSIFSRTPAIRTSASVKPMPPPSA